MRKFVSFGVSYDCFSPLPATKKIHLKMLSTEVVSCIKMITSRTNFGIQTNSVDIDLGLIWDHRVCYRDILNGLSQTTDRLAAEVVVLFVCLFDLILYLHQQSFS